MKNNGEQPTWWETKVGNIRWYKVLFYGLPFIGLFIIYIIFSFIAMNMNITEWWLIESIAGRIISVILGFLYAAACIQFYIDNDFDEI